MIRLLLEFKLFIERVFTVPFLASFEEALLSNAMLLAAILAPLIVFTIIIHLLEKTIQKRLAERFGWHSVLWTGWLGTPIHELSHAVMCVVFRHRIDELSLFEPDQNSGRLGYVKHSWRKGNWFEELGNFFIGVAPLMGGCVALFALLWIFYPESLGQPHALELAMQQPQLLDRVTAVLNQVLNPANFLTPRFWVFMYLVLCIGSHMAPSFSDYRGAGRASVMVLLALLALLFIASIAIKEPQQVLLSTAELLSPLLAVLIITVVFCSIATLIVSVAVSYFPQRYRVG